MNFHYFHSMFSFGVSWRKNSFFNTEKKNERFWCNNIESKKKAKSIIDKEWFSCFYATAAAVVAKKERKKCLKSIKKIVGDKSESHKLLFLFFYDIVSVVALAMANFSLVAWYAWIDGKFGSIWVLKNFFSFSFLSDWKKGKKFK